MSRIRDANLRRYVELWNMPFLARGLRREVLAPDENKLWWEYKQLIKSNQNLQKTLGPGDRVQLFCRDKRRVAIGTLTDYGSYNYMGMGRERRRVWEMAVQLDGEPRSMIIQEGMIVPIMENS